MGGGTVTKRDSSCPLCGAQLAATELLDAGMELIDARFGVLSALCPHCQGYLEVLPTSDRLDVGYTLGTGNLRFEVAVSLPCQGLRVERSEKPPRLILKSPECNWEFRE